MLLRINHWKKIEISLQHANAKHLHNRIQLIYIFYISIIYDFLTWDSAEWYVVVYNSFISPHIVKRRMNKATAYQLITSHLKAQPTQVNRQVEKESFE